MKYEQLTTQVSASEQICCDDVQKFVDMGVELLVCNRPDGEDEGQTPYADIEQQAKKLGLESIFMPFSSYQIEPEHRDEFAKLIQTRKRIHTYCRSGARSKRIWREANSLVGGEAEYNLRIKEQS